MLLVQEALYDPEYIHREQGPVCMEVPDQRDWDDEASLQGCLAIFRDEPGEGRQAPSPKVPRDPGSTCDKSVGRVDATLGDGPRVHEGSVDGPVVTDQGVSATVRRTLGAAEDTVKVRPDCSECRAPLPVYPGEDLARHDDFLAVAVQLVQEDEHLAAKNGLGHLSSEAKSAIVVDDRLHRELHITLHRPG